MLPTLLVSLPRSPVSSFNLILGTELAVYRGMLAGPIESSQHSNSPERPLELLDSQRSDISTPSLRASVFSRANLQKVSTHLQKYYPSTVTGENNHDTRDLAAQTVPGLVVVRLKEWLASPRSDLLWIIGSNSPWGSEASLAASHILDIATSARLPCVSFRCTPIIDLPHVSEDGKTRCVTFLVALLYSIAHQLLCLVPETFEDGYDLEEAIQAMNGVEDSIPGALETIEVLLRHRTPLLLVILDGLEFIEDDDTVPYLRNLINILHSRQSDSRLKVLLASHGFLESGIDLDVEERVDCTVLPRRRPGRAQPDGRFLGELDSFSM